MKNNNNFKRLRALIVTLFLIIAVNLGLSYTGINSTKTGAPILPDSPRPKTGAPILPDSPRPKTGAPILPDSPRPKTGAPILPDSPRP